MDSTKTQLQVLLKPLFRYNGFQWLTPTTFWITRTQRDRGSWAKTKAYLNQHRQCQHLTRGLSTAAKPFRASTPTSSSQRLEIIGAASWIVETIRGTSEEQQIVPTLPGVKRRIQSQYRLSRDTRENNTTCMCCFPITSADLFDLYKQKAKIENRTLLNDSQWSMFPFIAEKVQPDSKMHLIPRYTKTG